MNAAWAALAAARQEVLLAILGLSAVSGLIAVASPACFKRLASYSGRWIDTSRIAEYLDRRYDVDRYALRYPRAFGLAVIAAAAFLALMIWGK